MEFVVIMWMGLLVLFLIVEAACPLHLVSLWFAAGCLAALGVYFLGAPLWLQVTVFLVVSCALLAALWPLSKKYLKPRLTATNVDSVIGSTGYVTAAVDNIHGQGQVKLGAMEWTARSTTGEAIPEETLVRVDRIEGVKVFVTPVEVTAHV
jgi:membrane protein implicated in regulation of membrane protease activity